jgi:hypothetical protein
MLHHISIAVDHPYHVGQVLAEIMGGKCYPFPVHEGSYMAVCDDGYGTGIELLPSGTQLIPALEEAGFSNGMPQTFVSVHAAISVPISHEQIREIAQRENWLCRLCDRGPFKVIEFWIENKFLVEFLTPELAEVYLDFATPGNYEAFLMQGMLTPVEA